MKPPPSRVEGEGGGGKVESSGRLLLTPNAPRNQVSTLTPALLAEWLCELQRRFARAEALTYLGEPDMGFRLLVQEIAAFGQACRSSRRTA